jgi:DNA-binding MarR family transcriptional regulator
MSQPRSAPTAHGDSVREVLQAIRSFSDAMDRMHGGMKGDMAMNATDLAALRMLIMREQRGRSVSPHEMATHLRISTASTTKLLDRLTASGHVERRPHPHDRRARVVVLTDESRQAFFRHFGQHLAGMRGVAEEYSEEELAIVTRFLGQVSEVLDPQ